VPYWSPGRGGWRGPWSQAALGDPQWRWAVGGTPVRSVPEGSVPLSMLPPGSRGTVTVVLAGWRALERLEALGIVPGASVEVVENRLDAPWSPIIVRVGGVEVALGRGMASKVYVRLEAARG